MNSKISAQVHAVGCTELYHHYPIVVVTRFCCGCLACFVTRGLREAGSRCLFLCWHDAGQDDIRLELLHHLEFD